MQFQFSTLLLIISIFILELTYFNKFKLIYYKRIPRLLEKYFIKKSLEYRAINDFKGKYKIVYIFKK